jgi:hypothetical protein
MLPDLLGQHAQGDQGDRGGARPARRDDLGRRWSLGAGGAYARFVAPIIAVVWIAVVSGFLYRRRPATVSTPDPAAVPAT